MIHYTPKSRLLRSGLCQDFLIHPYLVLSAMPIGLVRKRRRRWRRKQGCPTVCKVTNKRNPTANETKLISDNAIYLFKKKKKNGNCKDC